MFGRRGFTLIELLIVVVIIGILAAIAIPKFASTKGKAYVGTMKSDLRNLATAQEAYLYDNAIYSPSTAAMNFQPSSGVSLSIKEATGSGWSAEAAHAATTRKCYLIYGNAAPVGLATSEGQILCDQ
ncbi:MAG: prepilin-type N-terminal cleavage/methylation domain-containing protein [Gemmatimonadales bacterium]